MRCKHNDCGWCYRNNSKYEGCPGYAKCDYMSAHANTEHLTVKLINDGLSHTKVKLQRRIRLLDQERARLVARVALINRLEESKA